MGGMEGGREEGRDAEEEAEIRIFLRLLYGSSNADIWRRFIGSLGGVGRRLRRFCEETFGLRLMRQKLRRSVDGWR